MKLSSGLAVGNSKENALSPVLFSTTFLVDSCRHVLETPSRCACSWSGVLSVPRLRALSGLWLYFGTLMSAFSKVLM